MLELVQILEVTCGDENLQTVLGFIRSLINLLCLLIPVGLIIFGSIDLGKAVISSDEKEIKGATSKLIKRAIAAVAVFFIPFIVNLIFGLLPDNVEWANCWNGNTGSNTQGTYIVR